MNHCCMDADGRCPAPCLALSRSTEHMSSFLEHLASTVVSSPPSPHLTPSLKWHFLLLAKANKENFSHRSQLFHTFPIGLSLASRCPVIGLSLPRCSQSHRGERLCAVRDGSCRPPLQEHSTCRGSCLHGRGDTPGVTNQEPAGPRTPHAPS